MTPRTWGLAAIVILASLTGCQAPGRVAILAKPGIHIGSTRIGLFLLPADFYALHPKLEHLFNAPVLFDPDVSGEAIAQHLVAGRRHFGILSGGEFASIKDPQKLEIVAVAIGDDGSPTHKGLIIASTKSGVASIADLKGKRFAFGPGGDLTMDVAARAALRDGGVSESDLAREIPIPPVSFSPQLHLASGLDVAKAVAFDAGIPAGAVDQGTFDKLPATGGNFLAGPSRDMYTVLGETQPMPGMVVVSGPKTDAVFVQKMRAFLLERVKPATEPDICKQLKVAGFVNPESDLFKTARAMIGRS